MENCSTPGPHQAPAGQATHATILVLRVEPADLSPVGDGSTEANLPALQGVQSEMDVLPAEDEDPLGQSNSCPEVEPMGQKNPTAQAPEQLALVPGADPNVPAGHSTHEVAEVVLEY